MNDNRNINYMLFLKVPPKIPNVCKQDGEISLEINSSSSKNLLNRFWKKIRTNAIFKILNYCRYFCRFEHVLAGIWIYEYLSSNLFIIRLFIIKDQQSLPIMMMMMTKSTMTMIMNVMLIMLIITIIIYNFSTTTGASRTNAVR